MRESFQMHSRAQRILLRAAADASRGAVGGADDLDDGAVRAVIASGGSPPPRVPGVRLSFEDLRPGRTEAKIAPGPRALGPCRTPRCA